MGEYLDRLAAARPAVNVASLVANGNLRLASAGLVDRTSTPAELRQMKKLLEQSLEEGAFGYSTGLEYGPDKACSEEEVIELCRVTAKRGVESWRGKGHLRRAGKRAPNERNAA